MEQEVGGSSPPNCTTLHSAELPLELPRHLDRGVWLTRACESRAFIDNFSSALGWGIDDAFPDRKFSVWIVAGDDALGFAVACKQPSLHPGGGAGLHRRRVPPLHLLNSRCRPCDGLHGRQKVAALAGLPDSFQVRCRAARSCRQARGPADRDPAVIRASRKSPQNLPMPDRGVPFQAPLARQTGSCRRPMQ